MRSRYDASCSKSSSVSPGNPTMMSDADRGVRDPRADALDERMRTARSCTAGALRPRTRLLACCSGRWKCGAKQSLLRDESDDFFAAVHRFERADAKEQVRLSDASRDRRRRERISSLEE